MHSQKADPTTRVRPIRGLVTRPLASVLLAMGAISVAAALPPSLRITEGRGARIR